MKLEKIITSILILFLSIISISCNKSATKRVGNPDKLYTGTVHAFDNSCGTLNGHTMIIKMDNNINNHELIVELTPDSLLYTSTLETRYQIIGKRISFGVRGLPEVNPERSITICTTDLVRSFKDVYYVTELN